MGKNTLENAGQGNWGTDWHVQRKMIGLTSDRRGGIGQARRRFPERNRGNPKNQRFCCFLFSLEVFTVESINKSTKPFLQHNQPLCLSLMCYVYTKQSYFHINTANFIASAIYYQTFCRMLQKQCIQLFVMSCAFKGPAYYQGLLSCQNLSALESKPA